MKYLMIMYMNPDVWESLSEDERAEVFRGHGVFLKTVKESGELVGTEALADPSNSTTVRVRRGYVGVCRR